MTDTALIQSVALVLVCAGVIVLAWAAVIRLRGGADRVAPAASGEDDEPLLNIEGNDLVEQFALQYLQVDALIAEGALKIGCNTRKVGGLFWEPVEVDSWSLALELFRRGKINFKTYTVFLYCRRIWIRLLAGHHDVVKQSHVNRCEKLVEQLNRALAVPAKVVNRRVSERLRAAGVEL